MCVSLSLGDLGSLGKGRDSSIIALSEQPVSAVESVPAGTEL